ncbi:unnamed protein product [Microthlaspi erraticum]|uniref:F-box domain-containing protein n=1 Tax=Microthlaspi erraticum TaxID=1685480 RepID=A0A6D2KQU7_9BRAS|nr:unnamed protein product [Microthlaspi erraticum]
MSSIPIDLIVEIFLRLPSKSVARFRCVSKQWGSILYRPDFTELFLTRSSALPRLLFVVKFDRGDFHLFSSLQPQNPYGKQSSLLVTADFRMKFNRYLFLSLCQYASGLIYFLHERTKIRDKWRSHEERDVLHAICNPSTGQYAVLPELKRDRCTDFFLGFDPIDKQFKVLSIVAYRFSDNRILTLGPEELRWRKIHSPLTHRPLSQGICIDGVLYYLSRRTDDDTSYAVVCFDVRSENFKFLDEEVFPSSCPILINYKGKLGLFFRKYDVADAIKLCLWVLDDVEKHEWSKYAFYISGDDDNKIDDCQNVNVVGVAATTGEIVLAEKPSCISKPFYVFYFNPEKNTLQRVEIQGLGFGLGKFCYEDRYFVEVFVDYAEDLNVNDAKIFKPSQGLDIIWKRPIPQHPEEVRDQRDMS